MLNLGCVRVKRLIAEKYPNGIDPSVMKNFHLIRIDYPTKGDWFIARPLGNAIICGNTFKQERIILEPKEPNPYD